MLGISGPASMRRRADPSAVGWSALRRSRPPPHQPSRPPRTGVVLQSDESFGVEPANAATHGLGTAPERLGNFGAGGLSLRRMRAWNTQHTTSALRRKI